MWGVYIHIPFCQQKCFYCDFVSYANMEDLWLEYAEALKKEIIIQGDHYSGVLVDTVYIGGGTPTVWPAVLLTDILAVVHSHFSLVSDVEITIEANPGTVDEVKLTALREAGVNRLSFGIQAFQDRILREIGRIHTAKEAERAFVMARKCGFENISVDLMYGLPEQAISDVEQSIITALALEPEHVSIYGLKVEEGTPFDLRQQKGELRLPDEETEVAMYTKVMSRLPQYGYRRYEISNFAKLGFESRHNLKYWRYQPYVGLGAGAHSFNGGKRYANTVDVGEYIQRLESGILPQDFSESLAESTMMAEYCFLGLRTAKGISRKAFEQYFQRNIVSVYGQTIEKLIANQLLKQTEDQIFLTILGMQYGNRVFCEFILD